MKSQYSYVWIFAFADLAFLLLIAFTQVSTSSSSVCFEMRVPKVVADVDKQPVNSVSDYYELRVLSPSVNSLKPFQLVHFRGGASEGSEPLDFEGLKQKLKEMNAKGAGRPLLSADEQSLSKDAFLALSLIESEWNMRMVGVIPGYKGDQQQP